MTYVWALLQFALGIQLMVWSNNWGYRILQDTIAYRQRRARRKGGLKKRGSGRTDDYDDWQMLTFGGLGSPSGTVEYNIDPTAFHNSIKRQLEQELVPYVQSVSPVRTGRLQGSIHLRELGQADFQIGGVFYGAFQRGLTTYQAADAWMTLNMPRVLSRATMEAIIYNLGSTNYGDAFSGPTKIPANSYSGIGLLSAFRSYRDALANAGREWSVSQYGFRG